MYSLHKFGDFLSHQPYNGNCPWTPPPRVSPMFLPRDKLTPSGEIYASGLKRPRMADANTVCNILLPCE